MAGLAGQSIGLDKQSPTPIGGDVAIDVESRGSMESFIGFGSGATNYDPAPVDFDATDDTVTSAADGTARIAPKYTDNQLSWGAAFTPANLFAAGEKGGWYDINDFASMFQDSAGTIPVTSVGQPVGRILDKSGNGNTITQPTPANRPTVYGFPIGGNLCADPNFLTGTGWTAGAGWTIVKPQANAVTAAGTLSYAFAPTIGKSYLVRFGFGNKTAGTISFSFGGVTYGVNSDSYSSRFGIVKATTTDPLTIISAGWTGKVLDVGIFDISTNADCRAPYFLYQDGVNDSFSCVNPITGYPFTLTWNGSYFSPTTLPGAITLYNGDSDFKTIDATSRGIDWGTGTVSSYWGFGNYLDNAVICDFTASANIAENQYVVGGSAANTNTFGTKPTLYVGRSRDQFPMFGITKNVLAISRILTAQEKLDLNNYLSAGNPIIGWGDSMTAAQSGAMGLDGSWTLRLRTGVNRWTTNKGAGGETSTQIKDRFVANRSAEKYWTNLFWMGTNDNYTGDYAAWKNLMFANIDTCISGLLGRKRYLVFGITQAEGSDKPLDTLDTNMLAKYGSNFLDIRAYLESKNDGSANDLADIAANLVPRSLRADIIHLNDLGNQYVANAVKEKLLAMGWL